jgi:Spy/CpxP family protein refolding chaperone
MNTRVKSMAPRGAGRKAAMVLTAMALTIAAAWSGSASSQTATAGPPLRMDMRHGDGMHGMHGGEGMRVGGGDLGAAGLFRGWPERMERHVDRMLDGLQATDAQRAEIKRIVRQAAADLQSQRAQGRSLRDAAMAAFTAPTIDPQALERARQQMLAQHDAISKRVSQAMLDAARVLTPEQRARIGQRLADARARMEDRMRRMERDGRTEGRGGPGGVAPAQPGTTPMPPAPAAPPQPRS